MLPQQGPSCRSTPSPPPPLPLRLPDSPPPTPGRRKRRTCPDTVIKDYPIGSLLRVRWENSKEVMDQWDPVEGQDMQQSESSARRPTLALEILAVRQPPTMAVVCLVRLRRQESTVSDTALRELPSTFICKFYDRRHALATRQRYYRYDPFGPTEDLAYSDYLNTPRAEKVDPSDFTSVYYDDDVEEESLFRNGSFEAFIESRSKRMWWSEVSGYHRIKREQEGITPRMFGTISLDHSWQIHPTGSRKAPRIYGILLEFIPSCTLAQFVPIVLSSRTIDTALIAKVGDQAVSLVDRIGDFGVLNRDVRLDNILVTDAPATPNAEYITFQTSIDHNSPHIRCIAIDFGMSRLRYSDETDEQWRRAKQFKDERGAVGICYAQSLRSTMKKMRNNNAGGLEAMEDLWTYQRSPKFDRELTPEEQMAYELNPAWGLYQKKGKSSMGFMDEIREPWLDKV